MMTYQYKVKEREIFIIENNEYLQYLPKYEQEIIKSYYFNNINQKDLAILWRCSQGGISSRIKRSIERIAFIKNLRTYDITNIEEDLRDVIESIPKNEYNLYIEIIKGIIETTSQTETASRVNAILDLKDNKAMNQIKVKHRIEQVIFKLASSKNEKHKKYYDLLEFIKNNLYKMHEVRLPHFDHY